MSSRISCAAFHQASVRSRSPRSAASRAPRSAATQHMTLENVKCWGSPRISQMPRSGSRQHLSAISTAWTTMRQDRSLSVSRDRVCSNTQLTMAPRMSNWCWLKAALPVRTGRLPDVAGEVVEGQLGLHCLAVDRVEHLEVAAGARVARAEVGRRLEDVAQEGEEVVGLGVESQRVQGAKGEGGVTDPRVAVVPVPASAGVLGQRRRRRGQQRAGRRVGQALEGQRAALEQLAPRVVGESTAVDPVAPEAARLGAAGLDLLRRWRGAGVSPQPSTAKVISPSDRRWRARTARPSMPKRMSPVKVSWG